VKRRDLLRLLPALATRRFLGAGPQIATASAAFIPGKIRFEEIGAQAGVRHLHHSRRFQGQYSDVLQMFTTGGAAVAVGDYDNDGYDDIFLTDSDVGQPNRLYHNNGNLTFTDVTQRAGVAGGNDAKNIVADALWFDYDNDGWRDLLIVRFGTPLLYHNEGNGTFKDVTARSGLNTFANSIAAIAFDYNQDGYLDILLGNYFQPVDLLELRTRHVLPTDLDNAANGGGVTLYHNHGDGTFTDVTEKAGLAAHRGWVLDVGHGDFLNDGRQHLYVACDYGTDRVYFNNGDGTFREATAKATGYDTKKGMNAEVSDYDNDGWLDIYVTNITDEYMKECNMLWHNNGDGTFTDVARETGTCNTLWGWGAKFGDFDNDGWQDLFAADGLLSKGPEDYIPTLVNMIVKPGIDFSDVASWPKIGDMSWSGFQKKKLFRNLKGQVFKEIAAEAGVDNNLDGRGVALADFDNDGRLDFLQTNADQPALLYHNITAPAGTWVELKLVGTQSNRDAIGARATLKIPGLTMIREVNGGNGYASQSTSRLHFGLGSATEIEALEIRWPRGLSEKFQVPINKVSILREGTSGN
jgi:ASPIC and UnbV/FG-GAP-like repeat